jgi:hypothetical protein
VGIASGVVRGRARDSVSREPFRDGVDALAIKELGEDPLDHVRRLGIKV